MSTDPQEDLSLPDPPRELTPVQPTQLRVDSARKEREIRSLVLDYAIGVSILGLFPIRGLLVVQLLVAGVFILKMMREIGTKWGFQKGQDALAIAGNMFGGIGAFVIALMAWGTMLALGLFVPFVGSFAIAAALFTLTWAVGQATNQFYASTRN